MRLRALVRDSVDGVSYHFEADSFEAYQRGRLFLEKEPRTIKWLREALKPSDVFLDIGANIGIFSLFAGKHIGPQGHVFACEPHLPRSLLPTEQRGTQLTADRS